MANFTTSGSDTFPAGHVIQTVIKQNEAQSHNEVGNSSTLSSNELTLAITTTLLNSKIDVQMISYGCHSQENSKGAVWLQRAISGGATTQLEENKFVNGHFNRGQGNVNNYEPLILTYIDSTGYAASTTMTWTARFKRQSGTNSYYFVHNGYHIFAKIQELSV